MKGTTGIRMRRDNAFKMLEEQLKKGTKPEKINGKTTSNVVPLTESDKKRITKEMEILSDPKRK
ncbi:MAG: hypothetical protein WC554_16460 [Clostridia bacterium]